MKKSKAPQVTIYSPAGHSRHDVLKKDATNATRGSQRVIRVSSRQKFNKNVQVTCQKFVSVLRQRRENRVLPPFKYPDDSWVSPETEEFTLAANQRFGTSESDESSQGSSNDPVCEYSPSPQSCDSGSPLSSQDVSESLETPNASECPGESPFTLPEVHPTALSGSFVTGNSQRRPREDTFRPQHFALRALQIGVLKIDWRNKSHKFTRAKSKILYGKRKLTYEFDQPLTITGEETSENGAFLQVTIEVDFSSIASLSATDCLVALEVNSQPLLSCKLRTTAQASLSVVLRNMSAIQKELEQSVRTSLYHWLTLADTSGQDFLRCLSKYEGRLQELMRKSMLVHADKSLFDKVNKNDSLRNGHQKAGDKGPPSVEAGYRCNCSSGCLFNRCGCMKGLRQCGKLCRCSRMGNCRNPLNYLENSGVKDFQNDPCLMENLSSSHMSENSFQQGVFVECCQAVVPRIKLMPGVVKCPVNPSCQKKYRFSWCANTLIKDDKRYHCLQCGVCAGKKEVHCKTCDRCHHINMQCPEHLAVPGSSVLKITHGQTSEVLRSRQEDVIPSLQEDVVTSTDAVMSKNVCPSGITGQENGSTGQEISSVEVVSSSVEPIISNVVNHETVVSDTCAVSEDDLSCQASFDQGRSQDVVGQLDFGLKTSDSSSGASSITVSSHPSPSVATYASYPSSVVLPPSSVVSPPSVELCFSSLASYPSSVTSQGESSNTSSAEASSEQDIYPLDNVNDTDEMAFVNGDDTSTVAFEDPIDLDCDEIFDDSAFSDSGIKGAVEDFSAQPGDTSHVMNIVSVSPDEVCVPVTSSVSVSQRTSVKVITVKDNGKYVGKDVFPKRSPKKAKKYILKNKPFGQLEKTCSKSNRKLQSKCARTLMLQSPNRPFKPAVEFVSDVRNSLNDVTNFDYLRGSGQAQSDQLCSDKLHADNSDELCTDELRVDKLCSNGAYSLNLADDRADSRSVNEKFNHDSNTSLLSRELDLLSYDNPDVPMTVYQDDYDYSSCIDSFSVDFKGHSIDDVLCFDDVMDVGKGFTPNDDLFYDILTPSVMTQPGSDEGETALSPFNCFLHDL